MQKTDTPVSVFVIVSPKPPAVAGGERLSVIGYFPLPIERMHKGFQTVEQ